MYKEMKGLSGGILVILRNNGPMLTCIHSLEMLGPIGTVLVIWLHQVIFKVLFEVNPSHTRHHHVACLTCSSCIQPPMSTPWSSVHCFNIPPQATTRCLFRL
ncbi:hypothetical protein BgiBS90_011534 [Biomphalaria glabrata]|nr:hypothetical protein BgiMline_018900 [Biomphalaria glabrata]KAI8788866.1 hypothetical protein BgiBS90_011534 [Biomphalaria glabrata]